MARFGYQYCDYYQGVGSCHSGCYDEPRCVTDEPTEGWPAAEYAPYEAFLMSARRLSYRMQKAFSWALTFSKDRPLGVNLAAHGLVGARFDRSGTRFGLAASVDRDQ